MKRQFEGLGEHLHSWPCTHEESPAHWIAMIAVLVHCSVREGPASPSSPELTSAAPASAHKVSALSSARTFPASWPSHRMSCSALASDGESCKARKSRHAALTAGSLDSWSFMRMLAHSLRLSEKSGNRVVSEPRVPRAPPGPQFAAGASPARPRCRTPRHTCSTTIAGDPVREKCAKTCSFCSPGE